MNPHTMDGKMFYPPSCMRKTNSHHPREWEERPLRHGEESKRGRGSGLPARQLLPQLTKKEITKGGGDT